MFIGKTHLVHNGLQVATAQSKILRLVAVLQEIRVSCICHRPVDEKSGEPLSDQLFVARQLQIEMVFIVLLFISMTPTIR